MSIIRQTTHSHAWVWVQIGLSMAYLDIWRRMESQSISSAYVVKDDAVFHDDFNTLFPLVSLIGNAFTFRAPQCL